MSSRDNLRFETIEKRLDESDKCFREFAKSIAREMINVKRDIREAKSEAKSVKSIRPIRSGGRKPK